MGTTTDKKPRMSRCSSRHRETRVGDDGKTYGRNYNGRQWLWGSYPVEAPSSEREDLPFFSEQPDKPFDQHYCGCMGWS